MLHKVAGAIRSERLLVGDGRQRELAFELVLEAVQICIREDRCRRSGLHVGDAAAVHLAVDDLAAPRVFAPPGSVVGHWEHVDMAVEDEMAAGRRALEGADDVRHLVMRRDDAIGQPFLIQKVGNERSNLAGVAGRVRALVLNEGLQEAHKLLAIAFDPIQKLLTFRAQNTLPVPAPCARHYRSFHRTCKYD